MNEEQRAKRAASQRKYYAANRDKVLAKQAQYAPSQRKIAKQRRVANKTYIDMLRMAPCMDCGNTYPPCAMDFDHVRGEKYRNVSALATQGVSQKKLEEEIAKCDIVCAVCHRIRTEARRVR